MKKFFIIISILISINILKIDLIFADTGLTTLSGTNNSGQLGCISDGNDISTDDGAGTRWRHGVPETNSTNPLPTGPTNCITHYYYPTGTYTKNFVYNGAIGGGYITGCDPGDRVMTWNESARTITCLRHDDTRPTVDDITNSNSGTNVLAVDNYNYTIEVSSGGNAPITRVDGRLEKRDNESDYNTFSDTSFPWTQVWNIKDVDHTRESDGGRKYTYSITMVCDEAGNCLNIDAPSTGGNSLSEEKSYDFKVFANTSLSASVKKVTENHISDSGNIADGTPKLTQIELKDPFGNAIIPASAISRKINFNWDVTNNMYLDQFKKTGNSVFLTEANTNTYANRFPIGTHINALNNQTSSTGIYDFYSKVYTPTSNQDNGPISDTSAIYRINNIKYSVVGDIGAISDVLIENSTNKTAKFSPLYYTKISGDLRSGFINNAVQHSKLNITKANSNILTTNNNIGLYFTGSDSDKFDIFHHLDSNCNNATNSVNTGSSFPSNATDSPLFPSQDSSLSPSNDNFCTRIVQKPGVVVSSSTSTKLSTHVKYNITSPISGNLAILYNSDYVGSGTTSNQNTVQAGIKATGISSSSKATSVVSDQLPNNVNIVGNASKGGNGALLLNQKTINKTEIRKNAINFAKNITSVFGGSKIDDLSTRNGNSVGYKKDYGTNGSILYFKPSTPNTNIEIDGDEVVTGKRTILIIGGNLYIKGNITYNNNNSILGVIVLKDDSGNGGNIYIDPSVTNLAGTFFADKSIISYNGTGELGGSASIFDLKNQLYINGSILFSENTLGGSTSNPKKCPAYVSNCTDYQKYDLNFLRRYYIVPAGSSNGVGYPYCKDYTDASTCGKVAGGGYFNPTSAFSFVSGSVSNTYKITSKTDKYYNFPLIIEYNSKITSSPPPLFKIGD